MSAPPSSRVLVLCGSFVERTTRQLARLAIRYPDSQIEIDVQQALADPQAEAIRRAKQARRLLTTRPGVAVISTPRALAPSERHDEISRSLAEVLTAASRELAGAADLLIVKGGATSARVVANGLAAKVVEAVGPLGDGAALWLIDAASSRYAAVVPGNTGDDETLVRLVDTALRMKAC
jgi:uncharacterized protein YgbK (DUF1537 family)